MNAQRLQRLTAAILENGLDGVALLPGANLLYLTGIHAHLSERPLLLFLPADDDPAIIIPILEAAKAEAAGIPSGRIFAWGDDEGYTGAFQQACAHLELSDYLLGIEALNMRVLEWELLQRYAPGLTTTHVEPLMASLRMHKDDGELAAMDRAVAAAETAMNRLLPQLQMGQTEKQIAALLTNELLQAGAQAIAFGPIVSAGPNGASPHAVPTDRPIRAGDLLVIDWGAIVDDYPADITRTYAVGEISEEARQIYQLVQEANTRGRAASRPGVACGAVDQAARAVIGNGGYGDFFIHRTGHGLGLEIHEPPYIMAGNKQRLAEGMVFTVEPGIYVPGLGGVRIEDNLVITAGGHRSLTSLPRHLIVVG